MSERLANKIRLKRPGQAIAADYNNSRKAAIYLFCAECVGGSSSEARKCDIQVCPLWLYRPGAGKKKRKDGIVPSLEHLNSLLNKKSSSVEGTIEIDF